MVGDADGRLVNVVPLVGGEVDGIGAGALAEVGIFGEESAVLRTNVEAGADFVGEASAVHCCHRRLLLHIERRSAGVADGQKDEPGGASLKKRVEFAEGEAA